LSNPYAAERYDPTLAQCSSLTLHFNGKTLTLKGGKTVHAYNAVSGRAKKGGFDYSVAAQKQKNSGPIPAGTYWIRPDEFWENAWYKAGPTAGWGNYRITIHPFKTTTTYERGGFFIHGGAVPGSAGCIDLASDMDKFYKDLKEEVGSQETCQIHLFVKYQ
jgi:type VI secretion system (T6SS) effector TldE1-like protein